jgi:hypothetical protein
MLITATEFKENIGKFLTLANSQDILISRNGKTIARLTNARDEKMAAIRAMRGTLKGSKISLKNVRNERLAKYEADD